MSNVFDTLKERGFIYQTTDEKELQSLLSKGQVSFYIGYDPSASSLHAGNLLTIMAAMHLQHAGHQPLIIVGGGTGMIGDPSGKTEMRQMLSSEDIEQNAESLKQQLSHYLDFSDDKAVLLNNAEWLTDIGYIEFLRDIGVNLLSGSVFPILHSSFCIICNNVVSACHIITFFGTHFKYHWIHFN